MGLSSNISMTNTVTGSALLDGTLIRQSANDFTLQNYENGKIRISTGSSFFEILGSDGTTWMGYNAASASTYQNEKGSLNIFKSGNTNATTNNSGIMIRTTGTSAFGMKLITGSNANAIIVRSVLNPTINNFTVTSEGDVFARKYTTTLNNIPDYVFEDNYKLMPLSELAIYIQNHKHLPNIPSAKEYSTDGVDLGEMNRLLLEKVEELTLYVLSLETKLNLLESRSK